MLLTLMYHKVTKDNFTVHLDMLVKRYPIVIPGDKIVDKLSVCLTFDDAYADFYEIVYPLLQKHNIKAVLAIAIDSIGKQSFCTWQQIKEMAASGFVSIASHSHSHPNLTDREVDLIHEIVGSKKFLENKLDITVNTFVYPFGKSNTAVHKQVLQHYKYAMRIGGALNMNWHNKNGYIYRIDAEKFWPHAAIPKASDYIKFFIKYISNTIGGK